MRIAAAITLCLGLAACGNPSEAATEPKPDVGTQLTLNQGSLIGFKAENGAHVWLGIPFAESTAGQNRWRAPRPVSAWDGIRPATTFAPSCPQFSREESDAGELIGSEDCLYLNVYAPPDAQGRDLPVMIWIHGGANVWGAASERDGSKLAVDQNVILVTVQYRLGPLGFFAHEALRDTADKPLDRAANFALLDLIASLKWVGREIATFGGNPDNVTIFGESAGGQNIAALIGSPLAKGLFHKAIMQSGGFDSASLDQAEFANSDFYNPSSVVIDKLGYRDFGSKETAKALRKTSLADLFATYATKAEAAKPRLRYNDGTPEFPNIPAVISDGVTLPKAPLRSLLSDQETFNSVPMIMGTTRDELKALFQADPKLVKKRLGLFPAARNQRRYDLISEYTSRLWRIHAVDQPAAIISRAGHNEIWAYRFDWDESGSVGMTDLAKLLGASHGFEAPFIFGTFDVFTDNSKYLFPPKNAESRNALSATMMEYWASFARGGQPLAQTGPEWPRYTENESQPKIMRFDSEEDKGISVLTGADSMDKWISDLQNDQKVSRADRCAILDVLTTYRDGNVIPPPARVQIDALRKSRCTAGQQ
ncbi:carboxylesterase/lipase family protein [Parasphingorhabdus cellanae]|uniref:carboxylesterase/lipase family protein n=1 Tax=Parasphingorhabdus cellanae TaxID=2806553 RepID=UPI001FB10B51|nr:carboxylesterase family protein [Parasphingorhabdus cellanae]